MRLGPHRRPAAFFAALFVLGVVVFFTLSFYGRPAARVGADGHYYYDYLVSLWKDHDLDFTNQYARTDYGFNMFNYGYTPLGRPGNPYSIGPALLWSPFFAVADVVAHVRHAVSPAAESLDGFSALYQRITLFGTFLYGFAGLLLTYRIAARRARPAIACLASTAAFVGGSVVWYALGQPSYSHAQSAFLAALLIDLLDPLRPSAKAQVGTDAKTDAKAPGLRRSLAIGLVLGLAADVRAEDVLLCLLPLVLAAGRLLARRRAGRRIDRTVMLGEASRLLLIGAAAFVAFTPQMLAWWFLYGRPLTVPMGDQFMHWGTPATLETLFSTRGGLFPFAPLWWLAVFVALPLWLRRWREDALAPFTLLVFLALVYVNSSVFDWWGGLAYGGRRFATMTPLIACALTVPCEGLLRVIQRNPVRAGVCGLWIGAGALLVLTLGQLGAWRDGAFNDPHGLPWPQIVSAGAGDAASNVESAVGDPFAWPGSFAFAAAHHTDLARLDVVAGSFLDQHSFGPQPTPLSGPSGRRYLLRGFGDNPTWAPARDARQHGLPRVVSSPACLAVPLNQPYGVTVELELAASGTPGTVSLFWNGQSLDQALVGRKSIEVGGAVRAEAVHRGVNELCLEIEGEPTAMGLQARSLLVTNQVGQ
jgi:hypothetical protein